MCRMFSGLILKDGVHLDWDDDSHERQIGKLKLKDDSDKPNFVRFEIIPQDGNIFNHVISNWVFRVDQDLIPEWFNAKNAESLARKELKKFFKERFLIGIKDVQCAAGRWFLKNSSAVLRDSSRAELCNSSRAELWDSSRAELWDSSSAVLRNSSRAELCNSSRAELWDSSRAELWDSSRVVLRNSSRAELCNSSRVELWDSSSAVLRNSSSAVLWDSSSAELWDSSNKYKINDNGICILRYNTNPQIIVANKNIKLIVQKSEKK